MNQPDAVFTDMEEVCQMLRASASAGTWAQRKTVWDRLHPLATRNATLTPYSHAGALHLSVALTANTRQDPTLTENTRGKYQSAWNGIVRLLNHRRSDDAVSDEALLRMSNRTVAPTTRPAAAAMIRPDITRVFAHLREHPIDIAEAPLLALRNRTILLLAIDLAARASDVAGTHRNRWACFLEPARDGYPRRIGFHLIDTKTTPITEPVYVYAFPAAPELCTVRHVLAWMARTKHMRASDAAKRALPMPGNRAARRWARPLFFSLQGDLTDPDHRHNRLENSSFTSLVKAMTATPLGGQGVPLGKIRTMCASLLHASHADPQTITRSGRWASRATAAQYYTGAVEVYTPPEELLLPYDDAMPLWWSFQHGQVMISWLIRSRLFAPAPNDADIPPVTAQASQRRLDGWRLQPDLQAAWVGDHLSDDGMEDVDVAAPASSSSHLH